MSNKLSTVHFSVCHQGVLISVEAGDNEPNSKYMYYVINQIYIYIELMYTLQVMNLFKALYPSFSYTFFEIRSQLTIFISKIGIKISAF
jgi:hypothetical protein